jgi:hypothetical protein
VVVEKRRFSNITNLKEAKVSEPERERERERERDPC